MTKLRMRSKCACCVPAETVLPRDATNEAMFAYLDKLSRAQWFAADLFLYMDFPISRERSRKVAKAWLRRAVLDKAHKHALSSWTNR